MNENGRYAQLRRALVKAGWRVTKEGPHFKAYPPDGHTRPIPIAGSPGKGRASANLRAQLKRAGFTQDW